jgi:Skp family chaperone for outer membrane proteins
MLDGTMTVQCSFLSQASFARVLLRTFLGISLFVLALPVLAGPVLSAEAHAEFRVATVDVGRVLNESKGSKEMRQKLSDKSAKTKKEIEAKRSALQATEEKLKAAKVSEDSREAEAFRNEARAFSRFVKDAEEDMRREFMKVNKDLTERALAVVKRYAEANKIDLVLDKSEQARGPVLFGDKAADITPAIIAEVSK